MQENIRQEKERAGPSKHTNSKKKFQKFFIATVLGLGLSLALINHWFIVAGVSVLAFAMVLAFKEGGVSLMRRAVLFFIAAVVIVAGMFMVILSGIH